jgi:hypothetical protein
VLSLRVIAALERFALHDHLCSIYESGEEHFAVIISSGSFSSIESSLMG